MHYFIFLNILLSILSLRVHIHTKFYLNWSEIVLEGQKDTTKLQRHLAADYGTLKVLPTQIGSNSLNPVGVCQIYAEHSICKSGS